MAYTLSVPFFPLFLQDNLGIQCGLEAWSGLSVSISFLISGLCAPFWGSLADKWGCFIASGIITLFSAVIVLGVKEVHARNAANRSNILQDLKKSGG
ncbi:hypothetical protein ACFSL6_02390 [Paenibacillus thailandensis]|uniref:Major facilitator superfamily (MFS) profile domain-containing protein n=1 Tax=Paenibacillus thailandensis TaxID=393250 RepID=A0ABW5QUZ8_9BACL